MAYAHPLSLVLLFQEQLLALASWNAREIRRGIEPGLRARQDSGPRPKGKRKERTPMRRDIVLMLVQMLMNDGGAVYLHVHANQP